MAWKRDIIDIWKHEHTYHNVDYAEVLLESMTYEYDTLVDHVAEPDVHGLERCQMFRWYGSIKVARLDARELQTVNIIK